jgi:hypothetical protein
MSSTAADINAFFISFSSLSFGNEPLETHAVLRAASCVGFQVSSRPAGRQMSLFARQSGVS